MAAVSLHHPGRKPSKEPQENNQGNKTTIRFGIIRIRNAGWSFFRPTTVSMTLRILPPSSYIYEKKSSRRPLKLEFQSQQKNEKKGMMEVGR